MSDLMTFDPSPFSEKYSAEKGRNALTLDQALLASLGYKQEFRREFSRLEVFGVSFSVIGVVPSVTSVLIYAIPKWFGGGLFRQFSICSSVWQWQSLARPPQHLVDYTTGHTPFPLHASVIYFLGWSAVSPIWHANINTIGLIEGLASTDWGWAVQVMAAASIGSDMTFTPTTQQIFGVFAAVVFCHAIVASLATRILARLQNLYIVLNILLCLGIIIALPSATPKNLRNTASYASGGFENLYGWPNGYAFILSFLAPLWSIGEYDSVVHISEEATNAHSAVPFAIIASITTAGFLGWALNIVVAFNMRADLEGILSDLIGQPHWLPFGCNGTLALLSCIILVQFLMGTSVLLASSRQTFAFARDGGLPFSKWIYRINTFTKTPVDGVWFAAFIALLFGLLAFAGTAAIGAIFALAIIAQNVAYSIPIIARFAWGKSFRAGPFTLGKFGLPIAVIAVAWMAFTSTVFFFPTTPQTNAQEMNYTVLVLGGVLLLALAYFYFPKYGGIYWFKGPIVNVDENLMLRRGKSSGDTVDNTAKTPDTNYL